MTETTVAIIGAGFGGLSAAIELQRQGITDFVIFERAHEVGGTWRDNTYPGCACDIPSHLYSLSHTPNPNWTRGYPSQPEIQAYVLDVVARHDLRKHLRCDAEVLGFEFDGAAWTLQIKSPGDVPAQKVRASFVIAALGPLNKPAVPDLPGRSDFVGPQFHSMHWDHSVDLRGKRVAVVGTGASAIQFIPKLAKLASQLTVYQRTPPWVVARRDAPHGPLKRWLFAHVPLMQRLNRWRIYWVNEAVALNFVGVRWMQRLVKWGALHHLKAQVADPVLRQTLTPDYQPGCKRLLVSDDYYPALNQPHVRVLASPIEAVSAHNIRTADGQVVAADVIIYGTGFKVTEFVRPLQVANPANPMGAQNLSDLWAREPAKTWLGLMTHGFPNLFLVVGPSSGLGSNSIIFMIEAQTRAISRIIKRSAGAVVEPKIEAQNSWYADVQRLMKQTVWASGCRSWYQSADGRIDTLWPTFTWRYWLQLRWFRWSDLSIKPSKIVALNSMNTETKS